MKHKKPITAMLFALCLLFSGCQQSGIRTVLMHPETETSQSDRSADDGALKEIHSFPVTATSDGKNVRIDVYGWMDEMHIWCETYNGTLCAVDDSSGFTKQIEDTDHQMLLGVSPDGRYALFTQGSRNNNLMLYDSQTEKADSMMQLSELLIPRHESLSFSADGRYMSFLFESYADTGYQLFVMVCDLQSHTNRGYVLDNDLINAYALQITQVISADECNGWLLINDKKLGGLGNAVYMHLLSGKASPEKQSRPDTGGISNLWVSCKRIQSGKGILFNSRGGTINQSFHWYENAAVVQTADGKFLAVDLRSGDARILADNVQNIAISPDGTRVALCRVSKAGAEIYTARIALDAAQMPVLINMRLSYTGRNADIGFFNQDGSKLLINETDDKDNTSNYRVLTFYTAP